VQALIPLRRRLRDSLRGIGVLGDFSVWRRGRADVLDEFTVMAPGAWLRKGLHQIVFRRAEGLSSRPIRLVFDCGAATADPATVDLPPLSGVEKAYFVTLPPAVFAITIEGIDSDTAPEVALRPVSKLRLARHIAVNRRVRRREAIGALARGDTGRAVDLLHLAEAPGAGIHEYRDWLRRFEAPVDRGAVAAYLGMLPHRPLISVVMPVYNSEPQWLDAALGSLGAQVYSDWELCAVDDASPHGEPGAILARRAREDPRVRHARRSENGGIAAATNDALAMAKGEWIAFLDHDDLLPADALAIIAATIAQHPDARIVYTDEDKIDERGQRSEPYFKSDWNRELFYAQNYLNHLTVVRRDLVENVGRLRTGLDGSQDYDLLLRCIEQVDDSQIIHAPFIAYHWRFTARRANFSMTQGDRAARAALQALDDHFRRSALPANAAPVPHLPYHRAKWRVPEPAPLVSLIIPTRDRKALLAQAVESILGMTTYAAFEILIVDNDSTDGETLGYFEALKARGAARIVPAPGPFNFSRINNIAVAEARGHVLGFINNDIKVRDGQWLEEMVSHFARPDVGAVGARLLYGDGRLQHAGVVAGLGGVAGHPFKFARGDALGPFSLLRLPRETSVVTAACMLVRAEAFAAVGGFNEEDLAVAFNDVDLCLKLRAAGHRIVWTPFAELDHLESVSRGSDLEGRNLRRFQGEIAYMKATWGATLEQDPYYNPNLTLRDDSYGMAFPPRVTRPWVRMPGLLPRIG